MAESTPTSVASIDSPGVYAGAVVCELADITLVIPRIDVAVVEHGREILPAMPGESACGWFYGSDSLRPVFALNSELRLTQALHESRTFLILLHSEPWPIGLACRSARLLGAQEQLPIRKLAAPLLCSDHPIVALARLSADRVAFICAPGALSAYVGRQATRIEASR